MTRITRKDGTPDRRYSKTGPRPDRWVTGPDPEIRRLKYKFLRARVQARYWCQEWHLTWEEYRDLMMDARAEHGRGMEQLNLARRDRNQGWHRDNVHFLTRRQVVHRPKTLNPDGTERKRQRRRDVR
jgi:hypothetical protein